MKEDAAMTTEAPKPRRLPDPEDVDQPLVVLELIQRLKVRDVMTREVQTARRGDRLRDIQETMKDRKISGIPIVEGGRLYGIISINDIINALEESRIDERCQDHMSTKLVVLEDDMPLSFAIQYFDKFNYGRFPVLSKDQRLVGIVCQRDINRTLLFELTKELQRLEHSNQPANNPPDTSVYMLRDFPIAQFDFENAGKAANHIRQILSEKGVPPRAIRRVSVIAYELEINLCVHSVGGVLTFIFTRDRVEIIAKDTGPGIPDVEWALRDGTSTASEWVRSLGFGAGLGLVNVKRVSDTFDIVSAVGTGTTVTASVNLAAPQPGATP